jgi:hypothetical protein
MGPRASGAAPKALMRPPPRSYCGSRGGPENRSGYLDLMGEGHWSMNEREVARGETMTDRKWTSIKGQQGQRWATVRWDEGSKEILPCVHQYYWKVDGRGPYYHDLLDGVSMQDSRLLKQFEQMRSTGRVIHRLKAKISTNYYA